jgi:hypothetical protein
MDQNKIREYLRRKPCKDDFWIDSAKQLLSQFDEQHASLLINAIVNCSNADKDMTLTQFGKIAAKVILEKKEVI